MTAQEMIKKFDISGISTDENGVERFRVYGKPTAKEVAEIRANKSEIISYMKAEQEAKKQEQAAKKEATVTFWVVGWESHEISIDTRYDIDEQLKKEAAYYSNDMTYESAKAAYEKAIAINADAEVKIAEVAAKKTSIFATAKATGEKQVLRSYMDDCDGSVTECSTDHVTICAMPDGSTTEVRTHTF